MEGGVAGFSDGRELEFEVVGADPLSDLAVIRVATGPSGVTAATLGDADAVPVGDYNLPHSVGYALEGTPRSTDERMLELLDPYRGHRARVIRLIGVAGISAPRFGPRMAIRDIAHN